MLLGVLSRFCDDGIYLCVCVCAPYLILSKLAYSAYFRTVHIPSKKQHFTR